MKFQGRVINPRRFKFPLMLRHPFNNTATILNLSFNKSNLAKFTDFVRFCPNTHGVRALKPS